MCNICRRSVQLIRPVFTFLLLIIVSHSISHFLQHCLRQLIIRLNFLCFLFLAVFITVLLQFLLRFRATVCTVLFISVLCFTNPQSLSKCYAVSWTRHPQRSRWIDACKAMVLVGWGGHAGGRPPRQARTWWDSGCLRMSVTSHS